ncbi:hypothetical protein H8D91_02160 [archaeon]|nr:hypothetical protein [archaeon]
MAQTRLIDLMNELGVYPQNWKAKEDVNQAAVDAIAPLVFPKLSNQDIVDHNIAAYSNSVAEYDSKKVNSEVIQELPMFMDLMPENGLVVDLAAGHLKDTLYMVDPSSRARLNREGVISPQDNKALYVVPIEGSRAFLEGCDYKLEDHMDRVPLIVHGDFMKPGQGRAYYSGLGELTSIFTEGNVQPVLDGIWSCAGQMVHMAPGKLEENVAQWSRFLKPEGVFAVSYWRKGENNEDMKLLASRSAPGEIKVFSHFSDEEVDSAFDSAGLTLMNHTIGDYDGHGHKMEGVFGNGFYKKS